MRVSRRRGHVILQLTPTERGLLSALTTQYTDIVTGDDEGDPAVTRLFPVAYRDDEEAAAEFRQYTLSGLIDRKIGNSGRMAASVETHPHGRLELDAEEVGAWLPAITDLRLVLAERLGIHSDADPAPDGELAQVYHWLAELQERLVLAVSR